MIRKLRSLTLLMFAATLAVPSTALGQNPPPQNPPAQNPPAQNPPPPPDQARGRAQRGLRQNLPPVTANMNAQEVQKWLDTWALIEAERVLQLTQEQYPNFVARLTRLHNIRRRTQMERRRALGEIGGLVQGPGPHREDAINERLRILDEQTQKAAQEIRQAYADLDAVMTPVQRGRFRLFEEAIERRKIDLLSKVRPGGDPRHRPGGR